MPATIGQAADVPLRLLPAPLSSIEMSSSYAERSGTARCDASMCAGRSPLVFRYAAIALACHGWALLRGDAAKPPVVSESACR